MKVTLISLAAYALTVMVASAILIIEPNNFDVRAIILPLIILLLVSSLGMARIFAKSDNKIIHILGTIAIAILLTFVGFFIVAGVAWFVAVGHTQ